MDCSACCAAFRIVTPLVCHPEAAEFSATPRTPNEGPLHLAGTTAAADESTGPSVRKKRGPQDGSIKALPISERFPLFIIQIRLLFASIYMYNPARFVLQFSSAILKEPHSHGG